MDENQLSKIIIDKCFQIHKQLGPGLFESVYEEILFHELTANGLQVERQKAIPVFWNDTRMDVGFRSDLIVDAKVLIEIKSIEKIAHVHQKQVLTYIRLANIKLGLLINFNEALLKDGIQRIVNHL